MANQSSVFQDSNERSGHFETSNGPPGHASVTVVDDCNEDNYDDDDDYSETQGDDDEKNSMKRQLKKYNNVTMGRGTIFLKKFFNGKRRSPTSVSFLCFVCFLAGSMLRHSSDYSEPVRSLTQSATTAVTLESTPGLVMTDEVQVQESKEKEASSFQIDYPQSVKTVVINIGSNVDPILPHSQFGPCARAIAVEPVVGCDIPKHPQLDVLQSAVADREGLATLKLYNVKGVSSSMAKPAQDSFWNTDAERGDGTSLLVPVVSLTTLLRAIPSHVDIAYLMTDMQGFDFLAVRSAGEALHERVATLVTEVWTDDLYTYDAQNDLCRDWFPFMTELGYEVVYADCGKTQESIEAECKLQLETRPVRPTAAESPGLRECNVHWVRKENPSPHYYDVLSQGFVVDPGFTAEEYATCT